ncbi:MAG: PD-(D/E)XK nuclease family protein [Candidatus Omnitrophica bacterium]|nr:PD-(D/E)XK nuclease family protein [Candidatus Omnitrophota bacterium]MDD5430486.1 PD-(D/E)XK nuclease family protein [Candidatus Omnitrophota bacterium]
MGKLKSELTWSFSRDRLFNECRRAYYYNYYASWGGWSKDADDFSRKAYILKNMRSIDIWIGDIIHQIIKWVIQNKVVKKNITFEESKQKAKQLLTKTWEQSRSRLWEDNPKYNLNLLEHYYKRDLDRELLRSKLEKVTKSINNFYHSKLFEELSFLSKESFLSVEDLDSFDFEGTKVFAIPDFAIKSEGYYLYDWKTGKPSDKDVLQLSFYVLYAVEKWGVLEKSIHVVPVYLNQEHVSFKPVEALAVADVKIYMRESIAKMKNILADSSNNVIDVQKCSKSKDAWKCRNCKFQEICT